MPFRYLQPNDGVALVCTGTTSVSESDPRVSAEYLMQTYGFQTRYHVDTFHALSAQARANIFFRYLEDENIRVIWSLRGGEGTADIIPYLEQRVGLIKRLKPKWMIGFSDFTPLLIYFRQRFNWPTIHGPGARQLPLRMINKMSEEITLDWLQGRSKHLELTDLKPLNSWARHSRSIRGEIIGGNLSLLHLSIKEIWELNPWGKILLIEEVNEKPHMVIRTLKHFHRIGILDGVKAIILAGFDHADTSFEMSRSMQNVLKQFAEECHCPVLFTDLIGHGQNNFPLPFYLPATLELGLKPTLKI